MRGKRQREADDLAVPDLSDDPQERKRVLSVLAQRRYSECSGQLMGTIQIARSEELSKGNGKENDSLLLRLG